MKQADYWFKFSCISFNSFSYPLKCLILVASFDYRLNPLNPIKECSSCGALYTTDYCCSGGILGDKIICDLDKTPDLSQRSPHNCPKRGHPVDGHYCQGCALLRKKFKEDLFTSCVEDEIRQDSSKPSNDNTNVVNALREPFVVNQDFGILNVKLMCDISEQKIPMPRIIITLVPKQEKSLDLLSHLGYEAFQPLAECPMMIHGKNTPILDVLFSISIPLDQFKYGGIESSLATLNKRFVGGTTCLSLV
nr:hypothetical protein [Tanacetum cinerariifolium]